MRTLTRLFLVILLFCASLMPTNAATPDFATPDFAYPEKVKTMAETELKQADAMSNDQGAARLRALEMLITADATIDPDTRFSAPALIAKQLQAPGLSNASRAMLLMFMAQQYIAIYTADRYNYDKVAAPLEPFPVDVATWSGEQFRHRIIALMDSAATLADATPLENYKAAITYDAEGLEYLPTVADFVSDRRLTLYTALTSGTNNYRTEKEAICKSALAAAPAASAPFFYWTLELTKLQAANKTYSKNLLDIYKQYADVEAARYLLADVVQNQTSETYYGNTEDPDFAFKQQLVALIKTSLKDFPNWYNNNVLQNALMAITQPRVNVNIDSYIAPAKDFEVKVSYRFCKNIEVAIYKLNASLKRINGASVSHNNPKVCNQSINATEDKGEATLTMNVPTPGKYAAVTFINGKVMDDVAVFTATPLLAIAFNGCKNQAVATVDFTTGAPLKGVEVFNNQRLKQTTNTSRLGVTDGNGLLGYEALTGDKGYRSNYLSFKYKGSTITLNNYIDRPGYSKPDTSAVFRDAVILTDRALYHPGDTIRWAMIVSEKKQALGKGKTLEKCEVKVSLYDANDEVVDTISALTDAYGRVYGTFTTRKGVLTGRYRITASDGKKLRTTNWVTVSDFKLPTFEAEVTSVSRDIPAKGDVTLRGKATTYAGMPVANAKVEAVISGAYRFFRFSPETRLGQVDVTTDNEGNFDLVVPAAMLNRDVEDAGRYHDFIAEITVTDPAAETATCTRGFTTGKPYTLVTTAPVNANSDNDITLTVKANNPDGENVPIAFRWHLALDGKTDGLPSGTGTTGAPLSLKLQDVPSNNYNILVEPVDSTFADPAEECEISLYSLRNNTLPPTIQGLIFMPDRNLVVKGRKASAVLGTNADKMYVYVAVKVDEKLMPVRVHNLRKGFNTITFDLPEDKSRNVKFATVYKGNTRVIEPIIPAPVAEKVVLETESFRDRLTPGNTETWRFRLAKGSTTLTDAAMIATMYNRSLDALQKRSWPSSISPYFSQTSIFVDYVGVGNLYCNNALPFNYLDIKSVEFPMFRYISQMVYDYGMPLYGARAGSMLMKSMVKSEATADYSANGALYDVVEVAEDAEEEESGAVTSEQPSDTEPEFEYRDAEVLQALWAPSLTADADGNIDLTFTVPNANSSWQFKAFAWNQALYSADYNNMTVTSKPIMVQPSLPRFLRAGDTASVMTTVYNRTDSVRTVNTTIELFDLETGKVLRAGTSMNRVPAMGSVLVPFPVSATMSAAAVGFRVRGTSEGFSDGEQAAIPLLPSSNTVIESTTFYLNPDQDKVEQISVTPNAGASVTLQYCQNPIWTVVRAMRGLAGTKANTSTQIASQLFSALIAKHIVATNPDIAAVIEQWKANPTEDALTSMLSQNEELKTLLLEQTPWVQASKSNTARMEALVQLLDPENAVRSINARKADLMALQCTDGGFAWGPWNKEASIWATETVLTTLGLARSLGADISSFDEALQAAYTYLQNQATAAKPRAVDGQLALIATLYPDYKVSVAASKLIRTVVADIAANWKKDGTVAKAYDVLILNGNGRQAVAKQVLASLRQFGVVKDGQGMCFPSVEDMRGYATIIQAFATMKAPAAELDAMRQWIIVQAQALDDLGAYNPDYIIAAVLLTGSDWTSVPVSQSLSLNGQPLEVGDGTAGAGYLAYTTTADGKPMTFAVKPNGTTPSYGSVITIDNREAVTVEAAGTKGLSIDKRFLVYRNEKWVATSKVNLGEKIRVQLTVKVDRDLEYVTITDLRAAGLQPVDQLPGFVWDGKLAFYRENLDAETRLFIGYLPKGTYHIAYDMTAATIGTFTSGIATLQSALTPELTAHSGGKMLNIKGEDE